MSTVQRPNGRRPSKDSRDWFGIACTVSVVLHGLILVLMPRPSTTDTEDLVVRAMAFIQKDVLDPIRTPAVPKITPQNIDNTTKSDIVIANRILKIPDAPITVAAMKQIIKPDKLKFTDRIKRRPGGKSKKSSGFKELIRRRISESCNKNVSERVRVRGAKRVVVLNVTILSSGELESVDVVESSNLSAVDNASIAAVRMAAPFPSFPNNLGLSELKLNVRIRFRLDGES